MIVPVFNAEAYIDQCIESVLNQSWKNTELILVNDGSTDESLNKCLLWKEDPRVKIISIENHGVSFARNLGLEHATGQWVMFLDSDDYLAENCLEELMTMASSDTQQILAAYTDGTPETQLPLHAAVSADSVREMTLDPMNNQLLPPFYALKPMSLAACWAKLYLNSVIRQNHIRFREDLRLSEDTLFVLDYLSCIENVVVTNLPVLCYRSNTASVTKGFRADHLHDRFRFFNILKARECGSAAVHILSLLLFEICKVEGCTKGRERTQLERVITNYLAENRDLLRHAEKLTLSSGKFQQIVYKAAVICFLHRLYFAGFGFLRIYSHLSKGDLRNITPKN